MQWAEVLERMMDLMHCSHVVCLGTITTGPGGQFWRIPK